MTDGRTIDPVWRRARVHEPETGNTVRFRTRSAGSRAGTSRDGHAGREVIRHNDGEKDHQVYVHRLAAFAWSPGMTMDDLYAVPPDEQSDDPRTGKMEVHHKIPIPWLNTEDNLEWVNPDEHSRVESGRKERGPDGAYAGRRAPPERRGEARTTDR